MGRGNESGTSPKAGLWRRTLLLIPVVLVLALVSYEYVRSQAGTFTAFGHRGYLTEEEFLANEVTLTNPGIVEVTKVELGSYGLTQITLHALSDGRTKVLFGEPGVTDEDLCEVWDVEVRDGAIIEGGINFDGWEAIHVSLIAFFIVLALLLASCFVRLWRASWYGYTMVVCMGGVIFFLFQALLYAYLLVWERAPTFYHFLIDVRGMVMWFVIMAVLPMVPLCIMVSLSNVALIRHEGLRPVNLLGIAASVAWGVANLWWLLTYGDYSNPWLVSGVLVPLAIAFGECLLFAVMLCAWLAAHHTPKHGMDYLVILGCGIRDDGTPCPLLAGRVDRAASFDEARQKAGDAPATFVPSGGQGDDEVISEALSMANYLVERWDVPRERIALEDRSVRTSENMRFSREVIERHAGRDASELRVGFSTTNYHVFRGYVCAHQAGMAVEGLGSKTKYYFWPNAFLREFVGLLAAKWMTLLQMYVVIAVIYAAAYYILRLV